MSKPGPKPTWDKDQLKSAVRAYLEDDDIGLRPICKKYGIPYTTLHRYVNRYKDKGRVGNKGEPDRIGSRSKSDSVRSKSDSVRSKSDSVRSKSDLVRSKSDPDQSGSGLDQSKSLDSGDSLGQMHAHKLSRLEGRLPWYLGLTFLAGWFGQSAASWLSSWWRSRQSGQETEVVEKREKSTHSTEDQGENLAERKNPNLPRNSRYAGKGLRIG